MKKDKNKKSSSMKVYETVNGRFVESNIKKVRMEEISPGSSRQETDDRALRNHFLKQNPFFYNAQTSPLKIDSIEEFLIRYKRKDVAFGDVIHDSSISVSKKRKVITQAFKEWNKEFIKEKTTTAKKSQSMVEVIGGIEYMGFKWHSKLVLGFVFVLLAFIMNPGNSLWETWSASNFGARIQGNILDVFQANAWVPMVGNAALYVLIILIMYSSVHNTILKDYKIQYRFAKGTLKKTQVEIDKEHKKKYSRVKRYYLSRVGRKNKLFPPISMKEIEKRKVGLDYFENVTDQIVAKANVVKKRRWVYKFSKMSLTFLSLAGAFAVVGYIVYDFVRGLF